MVWTTVDVWNPIKDWILGLRSGPWDEFLVTEVKVWDLDVGLSPGCRSGPQVEVYQMVVWTTVEFGPQLRTKYWV